MVPSPNSAGQTTGDLRKEPDGVILSFASPYEVKGLRKASEIIAGGVNGLGSGFVLTGDFFKDKDAAARRKKCDELRASVEKIYREWTKATATHNLRLFLSSDPDFRGSGLRPSSPGSLHLDVGLSRGQGQKFAYLTLTYKDWATVTRNGELVSATVYETHADRIATSDQITKYARQLLERFLSDWVTVN